MNQTMIYPRARVIKGKYCDTYDELVTDKKSSKCKNDWDCDSCSGSRSVIIIFDDCGYCHKKDEPCGELDD